MFRGGNIGLGDQSFHLFFVFSVNCGDTETNWLKLFNDPGPDGLDPQAGETPVGVEQDEVWLASTATTAKVLGPRSSTCTKPFKNSSTGALEALKI